VSALATILRKRPRLIIALATVIGLVLLIRADIWWNENVEIVHVDELRYLSASEKEKYFHNTFPTAEDIDKKLSNTTVLIAGFFGDPDDRKHLVGNAVYYFDDQHRFVTWSDDQVTIGHWWTKPEYVLLNYRGKWRLATNQIFCLWLDLWPADAQEGNCRPVDSTDDIIGLPGKKEYAAGDVFHLAKAQHPFSLPDTGGVSIERLLQMMPSAEQDR
jgi:hypothetical protein